MTILFTQIKAQHFIKETVRILNHDPSILYPQTCTLAFERFSLEANWHYYSFRQHYLTRIASSNFAMSQYFRFYNMKIKKIAVILITKNEMFLALDNWSVYSIIYN